MSPFKVFFKKPCGFLFFFAPKWVHFVPQSGLENSVFPSSPHPLGFDFWECWVCCQSRWAESQDCGEASLVLNGQRLTWLSIKWIAFSC